MAKITTHGGPSDSAAGVSFPIGLLPEEEEVRLPSPSPPPLTGKGSGRQVWADYAELVGVDPLGLSKGQLVELVGGVSERTGGGVTF